MLIQFFSLFNVCGRMVLKHEFIFENRTYIYPTSCTFHLLKTFTWNIKTVNISKMFMYAANFIICFTRWSLLMFTLVYIFCITRHVHSDHLGNFSHAHAHLSILVSLLSHLPHPPLPHIRFCVLYFDVDLLLYMLSYSIFVKVFKCRWTPHFIRFFM